MTLADLEIGSYILKRLYHKNITLERVGGMDNQGKDIDRWAIRNGDHVCMDKDGDWIVEPSPSSRDDAYIKMHRWSTAEEAYQFWLEHGQKASDQYAWTRTEICAVGKVIKDAF